LYQFLQYDFLVIKVKLELMFDQYV
jgi:hypothetical protein